MKLFLEQQCVRAQRQELLTRDDAGDDLADLLMDERLAAGNRHHRSATFVDGVEAFLHAQSLVENRRGIVDLAAAGAGEVATEKRLQHQHERIALYAAQLLLENVGTDFQFLVKRNAHS